MTHRTRRQGFTLIELMIAVAIVGVLAAVGTTAFKQYQYRSKRTEAMSNLKAIAELEITYFGVNGVYWGAVPVPAGPPSKKTWDAAAKTEFDPLGFAPEGTVWYAYDVNNNPGDCACVVAAGAPSCFTASAYGDLDGDGQVALVSYFHPDDAGNICVTAISTLGPPIDPVSGRPVLDAPAAYVNTPGSDDY